MRTPTAMSRRRFVVATASLAVPCAHGQTGAAAVGGQGPIRLVVPFTPGTGIDLIARQVSPHLTQKLGRPVVVENKTGAAGNIGTMDVVRAAPDGSTLLVTVNTLVMNRALYPKAGFDPLKDLDPVTLTSWGQLVLVASRKSGIESARQLVERAREKPGALNYGSPGAGTPHHLAMELLKSQTKTDLTHVAYRGTGPAVTDLLAGTIDVMFLPIHVALQHVKAGSIRALAISSKAPNPLLPGVPPLQSLDMGELDVEMWYGILAPQGTPGEIIERYNRMLAEILALPEVKSAFETQGMVPAHSTPAQFRALIERDAERWAALIKARNITAE